MAGSRLVSGSDFGVGARRCSDSLGSLTIDFFYFFFYFSQRHHPALGQLKSRRGKTDLKFGEGGIRKHSARKLIVLKHEYEYDSNFSALPIKEGNRRIGCPKAVERGTKKKETLAGPAGLVAVTAGEPSELGDRLGQGRGR